MTSAVDAITNLNDCGCCEGISAETPLAVSNRPGLSAILYRVGTQAEFKETLIARLSSSKQASLRNLTTRDDDDFTIALLDAWATVGDVLTFYQERIANESYLRTATERFSILELARLINYQLRPGVAASSYAAFTLEEAKGALGQALAIGTTATLSPDKLPPVIIGPGTKIQSIPGPGEEAQTFETVEEIEAHVTWNAIKPRLTQPQTIATDMQTVFFTGTNNSLKLGERILIVNEEKAFEIKSIQKITLDDKANTTRVDFSSNPPPLPNFVRPSNLTVGFVSNVQSQLLSNTNSIQILSQSWSAQNLFALTQIQGWNINDLEANLTQTHFSAFVADERRSFCFSPTGRHLWSQRAALQQSSERGVESNLSACMGSIVSDLERSFESRYFSSGSELLLRRRYLSGAKPFRCHERQLGSA